MSCAAGGLRAIVGAVRQGLRAETRQRRAIVPYATQGCGGRVRQEMERDANEGATNRRSRRIPGSFRQDVGARTVSTSRSGRGDGAMAAERRDRVKTSDPKRDGRRSRAYRDVVKTSSPRDGGSTRSGFTLRAKRERDGDESRKIQMFPRRSLEIVGAAGAAARDLDAAVRPAGGVGGGTSTEMSRNRTSATTGCRRRGDARRASGRGGGGARSGGGVHLVKTAGTERRRIADRGRFPGSFPRDVGGAAARDPRSTAAAGDVRLRAARAVHRFVPGRDDGGAAGRGSQRGGRGLS